MKLYRKYYLFFLIFAFTQSLLAQQDPEAKRILDAFSKKTKSYHSYKVDFTIISENRQNQEKNESKGTILVKGDKYKLDLNKTVIYFDGKYIYNYIPESNEVSISKPTKSIDDILANNPSKLFNIYITDYKFQYLGNIFENNRNCYEIDLYPFDIKRKYSILKLQIDTARFELVSARLVMKSGVNYTIRIDTFNSKIAAEEKEFIFNIKAHKGIEIVDLR
jgi:outer membrane lipoprotein-sorting protein